MKRIITLSFLLFSFVSASAQDLQSAIATRLFHFENNELADSSAEQLTPLNYGSVGVYTGSMKYTMAFEGVYYQAFYGYDKIFFRKSLDGNVWSEAVTVTDTTVTGYTEFHPNISVWRNGDDIHVGISYIDSSQPLEQLRFVKSTDGGQTFQSSVALSNHSDSNSIMNCGFSAKGDTLLATWTRYDGWGWLYLWESHSFDGGLSWSAQQTVYTGWQYTFVGDSDIDDNGDFYAVICADLGWRVELVMVKSTDFGQTWTQTTPATDLGSPNTSTNAQLLVENGIIYISATHSYSYLDNINLHRSEDAGQTWSTIPVSDSDSLHVSNIGNGTIHYCHTAVAKGGGNRLYMVWADSRDNNVVDWTQCNYYVYLSWSDDNGLTWSPNYRVSSASNTIITTNVYCNISVVPGETGDDVLVSWSKNRDVSLLQVPGCTAIEACNFNPEATIEDGSCELPGSPCDDGNETTLFDVLNADCLCAGELTGCADLNACNFTIGATIDDGSCNFPGDVCDDGDANTVNDQIQADCSCAGEIPQIVGCTDDTACNYDSDANTDDGSCLHVGDICDDGIASTVNDVISEACECVGTVVGVEEWKQSFTYFPNPATDVISVVSQNGENIEQMEIRDLQGRILMSVNVAASPAVIDISALSAARYMLLVKTVSGTHVMPLVIARN
jgi:hypothetical protein